MQSIAAQFDALLGEPVRYAAQIAWGHTPLSEDQAALLDGYHADPHPAKLAILGDHLQENGHELAGRLLSRALDGDTLRAGQDLPSGGHSYRLRTYFNTYVAPTKWAGVVDLYRPDGEFTSTIVPVTRAEVEAIHAWNRQYPDPQNGTSPTEWSEETLRHWGEDEHFDWGKPYSERTAKMQRNDTPIQFAAKKQRLRVHPLLRGTRLEIALKSLAKENRGTDVGGLARSALIDPTPLDSAGFSVFHLLNDALLEAGHPLAEKYNWPEIHAKLHLDHHLLNGVKTISNAILRQHRALGNDRYGDRLNAAYHVLHDARRRDSEAENRYGDYSREGGVQPIRDQLLAHGRRQFRDLSEAQFDESLARLHARVGRTMARRTEIPDDPYTADFYNAAERDKALRGADENVQAIREMHADPEWGSIFDDTSKRKHVEEERAEHYARTPSVGGVKNALRLLRSDNQRRNREVAATVLDRLGLSKTKLRDAVTSTRSPVAGVVAAIYHNGDESKAEQAAAWIGHLQQLPAVSAFHLDPSGPDSVYKLDLPLDPVKAASYLESHGISRAVLSPNRDSTSVLIHDPGNRQRDRVEKAAIGAGVNEVQHSVGRTVSFGGDSSALRANAAARRSYRDAIGG